jgi:hypothetical protein|tara:strand:+ start:68 stop:337 length:270 start_codon:yes stop_codon:yes gene_type:complete
LRYAKGRYVLVKKGKTERKQNFKADMRAIKKEDVRRLQETYSRFFGAEPEEMKRNSSNIRKKVYFFGFALTFIFGAILYFTKNVKFLGF